MSSQWSDWGTRSTPISEIIDSLLDTRCMRRDVWWFWLNVAHARHYAASFIHEIADNRFHRSIDSPRLPTRHTIIRDCKASSPSYSSFTTSISASLTAFGIHNLTAKHPRNTSTNALVDEKIRLRTWWSVMTPVASASALEYAPVVSK